MHALWINTFQVCPKPFLSEYQRSHCMVCLLSIWCAVKILALMNTDLKVSNILSFPDMYFNFPGSASFQVKRIKYKNKYLPLSQSLWYQNLELGVLRHMNTDQKKKCWFRTKWVLLVSSNESKCLKYWDPKWLKQPSAFDFRHQSCGY